MSNVSTSDWSASINSDDGMLVVSYTVAADSGSLGGVGLVVSNSGGHTVATAYVDLTGDANSASPAINVPADGVAVGDTVVAAATGEAGGEHFFEEKRLTVTGG